MAAPSEASISARGTRPIEDATRRHEAMSVVPVAQRRPLVPRPARAQEAEIPGGKGRGGGGRSVNRSLVLHGSAVLRLRGVIGGTGLQVGGSRRCWAALLIPQTWPKWCIGIRRIYLEPGREYESAFTREGKQIDCSLVALFRQGKKSTLSRCTRPACASLDMMEGRVETVVLPARVWRVSVLLCHCISYDEES